MSDSDSNNKSNSFIEHAFESMLWNSITLDEARNHPHRHVLYRYRGCLVHD